jgi:predicted PurR-regulated permease PerM
LTLPDTSAPEAGQRPPFGANVERLARLLFWLIALYLGGKLLVAGASLMAPVLQALLIAFFMEPIVAWMERKGVGRPLGIAVLGLATLGLATLFGLVLIPFLFTELASAVQKLPDWAQGAWNSLSELLRSKLGTDPTTITPNLSGLTAMLEPALLASGKGLLTGVQSVLGLILVPILAFYLSVDWKRIVRLPLLLIPLRFHEQTIGRAARMSAVAYGWAAAQMRVGSILAVLYGIGLTLSGVRYGWLIGLIAGYGNMVPYVGTAVGLSTALLILLLDGGSIAAFIGIGVTFVVTQLLEGYVITPRVVGEQLGLSPLALLIILMIGGGLFGFFGMMLAIPTAAALTVLGREYLDSYHASATYKAPETSDEG